MFFQRQMYLQCFQYSNLTFSLVGFVVDISSKLRGPEIVSGYPRVISVAHWMYLSQLGRRDGAKRTMLAYIIFSVSGQVVYSHQSGHHKLNSSLLQTLCGCLSMNTQKYTLSLW